jgi:hypothetical protein
VYTLSHAVALCGRQILPKATRGKAVVLVAEMVDGGMIPTVQYGVQEGAVSPVFAVTLGSPEEAGRRLEQLAESSAL